MTIKAKRVAAVYKVCGVSQIDGNPYTEALSGIYFHSPAISAQQVPEIPEAYWDLPDFGRKAVITTFRDFFLPNELFSTLYKKIFNLAILSYSNRNPLEPDVVRQKMAFAKKARENDGVMVRATYTSTQRTTAMTILVHGLSGTGKTTSIRNALALIPQVICHEQYKERPFKQEQLVWISFDIPVTPSIKGLAANFYQAVDKALGTDYLTTWSGGKNYSVDRHLLAMQQITQTHDIGLIHIDEMQWLLGYARSANAPTLVMLEALFNKIGIPVVMSCTNAGLKLFQSEAIGRAVPDFTITRRMVSDSEIAFSEIRYSSKYYHDLFLILFPAVLCKLGENSNEDFKLQVYSLTCGIPDILARLAYVYHSAVDVLYEKGRLEKYSAVKLLNNVFSNEFARIKGALDLLRNGQVETYEKTIRESHLKNISSQPDGTVENLKTKSRPVKKQKKCVPDLKALGFDIPVGIGES